MLSVKQGGIKYHYLKVFRMTRTGIESRSPGPLANTLPTSPMSQLKSIRSGEVTLKAVVHKWGLYNESKK